MVRWRASSAGAGKAHLEQDARMKRDIPTKVARFVFGTGYGAPLACAAAAAGTMAGLVFFAWWAGIALFLVFLPLLLLSLLWLPVAFVHSLFKRRWGNAAAQLVLGLLALGFCAIGLPASVVGGWAARDKWKGPEPWMEAKTPNGVVPFEVEYRDASILDFAEHVPAYERRVAFPSGKRVELASVRGGNAELEVFALGGDSYALEDPEGRHFFRVDAADESVRAGEEVWVEGEGCLFQRGDTPFDVAADGGEEELREIPPYDPLPEPRRPLGRFCPPGRFVPEGM